MKKKIIAFMLILTLVFTAGFMCACGENEDDGEPDVSKGESGTSKLEPIELNADMTLEEVVDAWNDAKSITIYQVANYTKNSDVGDKKTESVVKITTNAFFYSVDLTEYWHRDLILLYEDGILYQFYEDKKYNENNELCDEPHNYFAQQVTLDDITKGKFTIMPDIDDSVFHYTIPVFAKYLSVFTISNYLKQIFVDTSNADMPDGWRYDISYSIQDNNLTYNIELFIDDELMLKTVNKLSDINCTNIDIPAQYANYKSLALTA